MDIIIAIIQTIIVILIAPLVSGFSRWLRAKYHTRTGPPIYQDYLDIYKSLIRQDVQTKDSSFIHRLMPPMYFGSMCLLCLGVPIITRLCPIPVLGDIIFIIYLLALPRFFYTLSGIDSSNSYAGVGGIREMLISTLAEPAMILALLVVAIATGSMNIGLMGQSIANLAATSPLGVIVAGVAFALACYVEMGKLPYDVSEAEQELDEGPVQEYSGPSLAMLKVSISMKQILIVSWWLAIFFPLGSSLSFYEPVALLVGLLLWLAKIAVIFFVIAAFENSVARVRYRNVGSQTWTMVGIAAIAFALCVIGI